MTDIENFQISNVHKDDLWQCPDNGECFRFDWSWHDYSGFGMICLINGVFDESNAFCKESSLTISTSSKRHAGKDVSEVYNEPQLAELMIIITNRYFKN